MRSNTTVHFRPYDKRDTEPSRESVWRKGLSGTAAVVFVLMSACAVPGSQSSAPQIPRCTTLIAQALTSPNAVVVGVYNCLTPTLASAANITSDNDFQVIAQQTPVYTSYRYVDKTVQGYYFEFSSDSKPTGCFRFHLDGTGHIDHVASGAGPCPHPLP
jgi:hypothetical protein